MSWLAFLTASRESLSEIETVISGIFVSAAAAQRSAAQSKQTANFAWVSVDWLWHIWFAHKLMRGLWKEGEVKGLGVSVIAWATNWKRRSQFEIENELLCNQRRVRSAPVFGLMPSRSLVLLSRFRQLLLSFSLLHPLLELIGNRADQRLQWCARVIDFKRLNYAKLLLLTSINNSAVIFTCTHTHTHARVSGHRTCNYLKYIELICCQCIVCGTRRMRDPFDSRAVIVERRMRLVLWKTSVVNLLMVL